MRKLIGLIFLVALLWGGYWFVGSSALEKALAGWLQDRQNDGWVAEYSSLNTRGFPNRFDTTITDIELADPRTGVAWTAPQLDIFALSYRPNHIIAFFPATQTIASPYEKISITSERMHASVIFEPGTNVELRESRFELDQMAFQSDKGWRSSIKTGFFATRKTAATPNAHDIYFEASGVTPSKAVQAQLNPAAILPDIIETMVIDSSLTFDAPWDRFAIERARPQITALDLKELRATWGDLDLRAAGDLTVDNAGIPDGSITIKAQNWREMLQIAVSAGLVPTSISITVERGLEFLANMSGNPNTLDAPLTFRDGAMFFGPIPLGPAPRLIIR